MKTLERLFVGAFGVLLLGVGIYAVMMGGDKQVWRYLGGIALCVLGVNAVYGSLTNHRPWISRIGPLP